MRGRGISPLLCPGGWVPGRAKMPAQTTPAMTALQPGRSWASSQKATKPAECGAPELSCVPPRGKPSAFRSSQRPRLPESPFPGFPFCLPRLRGNRHRLPSRPLSFARANHRTLSSPHLLGHAPHIRASERRTLSSPYRFRAVPRPSLPYPSDALRNLILEFLPRRQNFRIRPRTGETFLVLFGFRPAAIFTG
jgi:hypothetical protein